MRADEASAIVDEYARQIRRDMSVVQQGDGVCVVTPMLNRNNDCMNVYMSEAPGGGIVISDMGETIGDLEFSGFKMTEQRTTKLRGIIDSYGVRSDGGQLYVTGSRSEIAGRMNMLIQAMASVDDMYVLSQPSVRSLFAEDVGAWMLEHGIVAVEGPSFTGRSGMTHKFDYAIGKSKRSGERLIKAVNNPHRAGVQNALFGWEDVKASRRDSEGFVFLNAKNVTGGSVPEESILACRNYSLTPVIWGVDEDRYIGRLVA